MMYHAPISAGDLLDRLSILSIKVARLPKEKADIAFVEYEALQNAGASQLLEDDQVHELYDELVEINEMLWDVENSVRIYHKAKNYGLGFVQEARKVAPYNDDRAKIKLSINRLVGSTIVEMKSHF